MVATVTVPSGTAKSHHRRLKVRPFFVAPIALCSTMLSQVLRPCTRRATRLRDSWTHAAVTRQRFYSSYPADRDPCRPRRGPISYNNARINVYCANSQMRLGNHNRRPEALSLSFSGALVGAMITVQTIFRQLSMIPVAIYRAQRRRNLSSGRSPVYGPPSKPYRPAGVTSGRHGHILHVLLAKPLLPQTSLAANDRQHPASNPGNYRARDGRWRGIGLWSLEDLKTDEEIFEFLENNRWKERDPLLPTDQGMVTVQRIRDRDPTVTKTLYEEGYLDFKPQPTTEEEEMEDFEQLAIEDESGEDGAEKSKNISSRGGPHPTPEELHNDPKLEFALKFRDAIKKMKEAEAVAELEEAEQSMLDGEDDEYEDDDDEDEGEDDRDEDVELKDG
ncbi:hypothetical protein IMY05_C4696000800 [Salix suchowensis]|nr:hypothetical protein IMY05_C4696000800 [Salix suchowensis]